MEPETLLPCPYDKSHQVRAARLPYHLVKCERNNPCVARTVVICPFNARHRVPRAELQSHVASCPDKCDHGFPHGMDTSLGDRVKQPAVPRACQKPPCQEDWEAEVEDLEEEEPSPFILSIGTPHLLPVRNSSAPAAPTNHNRDGGASGHVLQAQESQNRGARGSSAPLADAAERCFTHKF